MISIKYYFLLCEKIKEIKIKIKIKKALYNK